MTHAPAIPPAAPTAAATSGLCVRRIPPESPFDLSLRVLIPSTKHRPYPTGIRFAGSSDQEADMKRILITAGLACAIALPVGAAQTATPSGQSGQTSGSGSQGAKPSKPTT